MTITVDLSPEIERWLVAQAQLYGLSVEDYVREIVTRDVQYPVTASARPLDRHRAEKAANLIELSEAVRGVLKDDEIDVLFSRDKSTDRPIDLS